MRSLLRRGALATATVLGLGTGLEAQDLNAPTLLPRTTSQYPVTTPVNYQFRDNLWNGRSYAASHQPQPGNPPIPPAPMPPAAQRPMNPMPMNPAPMPMNPAPMPMGTAPMNTPPADAPMGPSASPSDVRNQGGVPNTIPVPPNGNNSFMSGYYGGSDHGCGDCGSCDSCCTPCCGLWFGSTGGVIMGRDRPNHVCYSFNTANAGAILLSNHDAEPDWGGGVEVRFGKYLTPCKDLGIEAVYWGVYPSTGEANAYDPDGTIGTGQDLNSALSFQSLNLYGGPIVNLFDNAARHRLLRSNEWHNVEINLFGNICQTSCDPCNSCGPTFRWYGGLRYFKFNDGFQYWSDDTDTQFTGSVNEAYYNVDVDNNLFGFQAGGLVDYAVTCRLSVYGGAKIGVFGNYMDHSQFVGGPAGAAVISDPANTYNGAAYDVHSDKTDASFLAEFDFGLDYQIWTCLSVRIGYRAIGVTGVALSDHQIPMNFGDLDGANHIDSNGSLILHGGYGAVVFNY